MAELDPHGAEYAQVAERFHRAETEFRARDGYAIEAQVGAVLSGLGFPQRDWKRRTEEFSGGWQMRIALAKLLLEKPNLLLLDEPTNHLDLEARNWLEEYLAAYPYAFVLVSHDRYFLDVTVRRILELWNKGLHFYTGGYTRYEEQKNERRAQLQAAYANQQDRIRQLEAFINRFRYQATKAKQVQSRIKELERIEKIEIPPEEKSIHFSFPQPKPSGRIVAEFRKVAKSYGDHAVFADVDFFIERGDRVALVGVNGAGKSTLIKLLAGRRAAHLRRIHPGPQRPAGLLRAGSIQGAGSRRADARRSRHRGAARHQHRAARRAGLVSVLRGRCFQDHRRALRRRAQPLRPGAHAADAVEFPAARRAHQPPRHARQGRAAGALWRNSPGRWSSSPTTATSSTSWPPASSRWKTGGSTSIPGNYEDYQWRKSGKQALAADPVASRPPPARPRRAGGLPQAVPAANGGARPSEKRLNPIKMRQMKERQASIEIEVTQARSRDRRLRSGPGQFRQRRMRPAALAHCWTSAAWTWRT